MHLPSLRLLPILLALCATSCFAQQAAHRFALSAGADYIARQDQVFSPFVHKGFSAVNAALSWERNKRLDQLLELRFSSLAAGRWPAYQYSINPKPEQHSTYPHHFTMAELNYGLAVSRPLGNVRLLLGGALENNIQALNYQTGPFSFFGYFAAFGIGPWVGISTPAGNKAVFDLSLRAPLASWTARSPYLINDDEFIENTGSHSGFRTFMSFVEDGALHLPGKLQKATLSARYLRTAGKRWELGMVYRLQFIRHTEPLTLLSYQHSLGLQLGLKAGKS